MRLDPFVIRAQIESLLAANPELAEDEVLRADMIEGETEAFEFLRIVERQRQEAAAMKSAIEQNIQTLVTRGLRFERREEAMRVLAFKIMQAADLPKAELPEATYSIAKPRQRVIVNDELSVPSMYRHPPVAPPDKKKIKEALEAGEKFNWASLIQGEPSLTVRTK